MLVIVRLVENAGAEAVGSQRPHRVVAGAALLLLGVVRDRRRSGIASALVRMVVADCAARGVVTLHLEVRSNNPAVRFYTAHGFAKCGERRNYYKGADGQHYDAHTYARPIEAGAIG